MKSIFKKINLQIIIGSILLLIVVLGALFAPLIAPYHPIDDANLLHSLEAPGGDYILGTDIQGRDLFSRILYGARVSLMVGIVSQAINTLIGTTLGLIAGFAGGKIDDLIVNLTNMMLSIPALILALAIISAVGPNIINIFIALGFTMWTWTCRVARARTLSVKEKAYVEAARAIGASKIKIVAKHILPNILGPIIVIATLGTATAILMEATLSFLGVGIQPPQPSWGVIMSRGREHIWTAPWHTIYPGIALIITVLGLNLMGDGLRDILDPHLRR